MMLAVDAPAGLALGCLCILFGADDGREGATAATGFAHVAYLPLRVSMPDNACMPPTGRTPIASR